VPPDSSPCGPTRGSTPSSMFATSSPSTSDGTNNGPDGCVDLADFAIGVRRPDMGAHPTTRSRWFRSFRWSTARDRSQYERGRGQPGSLGLSTVRASGGGSPIVPMRGGSIARARVTSAWPLIVAGWVTTAAPFEPFGDMSSGPTGICLVPPHTPGRPRSTALGTRRTTSPGSQC